MPTVTWQGSKPFLPRGCSLQMFSIPGIRVDVRECVGACMFLIPSILARFACVRAFPGGWMVGALATARGGVAGQLLSWP